MEKRRLIYPLLILILFLIAGMVLIRDYGASADEHMQIEGGHVLWRYLCRKFDRDIPEPLQDLPDLPDFKNSYYGQAATFPTVILEALNHFTLDTSTVLRIRHYWNFFCYFAALCCFSAMIVHMTGDPRLSALWLLMQIFLPRIFGDIFYNDRDIMLLSWLMMFLAAFYLFVMRPGWLTALLSAAVFAFVVNVRIFCLVLLVVPVVYFLHSDNRKYSLLFFPAVLFFCFLLFPVAWEDPIHILPNAIRHLSTQQRYLDTGSGAEVLFFGKYYNETMLPRYYIPLYIVVTTPFVILVFLIPGFVAVVKMAVKKTDESRKAVRTWFGIGFLAVLAAVPLIGIVSHIALYNGWRHLYCVYLPITWISWEGVCFLLNIRNKLLRWGTAVLLCGSFAASGCWILKVHPYQSIYLSPLFRSQWIGKFDRDYWRLSTTECMRYLLDNAPEIALNVVDKYSFIEYSEVSFLPQERERFHSMYHSAQPVPFEYLFFNYDGESGNDKKFDYYAPVYAVERDGIKLAEVFMRTHNNELRAPEITDAVSVTGSTDDVLLLADGDYGTSWYGEPGAEIVIKFKRNVLLDSLEIFPAAGSAGYLVDKVSVSQDGETWVDLDFGSKGSNGTAFPPTDTSWLKLESGLDNQGIREILFYGR